MTTHTFLAGTHNLNKELHILLDAIQSAGKAVEDLRQHGYQSQQKANQTPVTEADWRANTILKQALLGEFPNDGWLSEETVDDATRLDHQRVWIVDPIDGTKEFISNIPEYAISVALIENNQPILAAIYNPATQELFHAIKGYGAWQQQQQIFCDHSQPAQLRILASRTEFAAGDWDDFKLQHQIQETGSIAYKLALIAKGTANATFSLSPKSEWDIAAGTLLVEEARGAVTQLNGAPFRFNQANTRLTGIIACSTNSYPLLFSLIQPKLQPHHILQV